MQVFLKLAARATLRVGQLSVSGHGMPEWRDKKLNEIDKIHKVYNAVKHHTYLTAAL